MTLSDIILIGKKILVGLVLIVIPFLILWGGISLSLKILTPGKPGNSAITTSLKNNHGKAH